MRTAEEILKNNTPIHFLAIIQIREIEKAINEARKEAIEECAERSRYLKMSDGNFKYLKENSKESILSLIKELK